MANVKKLADKLDNASVVYGHVETPDGIEYVIRDANGNDITATAPIQAVLSTFDETDYISLRQNNAINQFLQSPLATMKLQDGYDWIDAADLSDPDVVATAFTHLWTMCCAFRNYIWAEILGDEA